MPSQTFTSSGTFTVPSGISRVLIECDGADGGGGFDRGRGGRSVAYFDVSPGDTLNVFPGSSGGQPAGGANGGGDAEDGGITNPGYGGGGKADVRLNSTDLTDAMIVAGGGGGEYGVEGADGNDSAGGDGGGPDSNGVDATDTQQQDAVGGDGGTLSSGGSGGTYDGGGFPGGDGSFGQGGVSGGSGGSSGGGGGGGYYGGGGGAKSGENSDSDGSGGGGSGYVNDAIASEITGSTGGTNDADGRVIISYTAPPENLTTTANFTSVDLDWDSVSGADSYNIYRDGAQIDSTTTTSYSDTGLSTETAYTYEVTAVEDGTESDASNSSTATTEGAAPADFTVSGGSRQTALAWTDTNSIEDGYEVHRSQSPGVDTSGTPVTTTAADAESYTDTGASLDGTEYHYRVVAVKGTEQGDDSAEVSAITNLPAPTDLSAGTVGDTTADLSWTANHNNGDTRVEVSEGDDGTYSVNTTVAFDTETATAAGLLNGQLYGVRVVADTGDAETEDV